MKLLVVALLFLGWWALVLAIVAGLTLAGVLP